MLPIEHPVGLFSFDSWIGLYGLATEPHGDKLEGIQTQLDRIAGKIYGLNISETQMFRKSLEDIHNYRYNVLSLSTIRPYYGII